MPLLTGWESFYVIVGSSAGALIGLQFVVITLISESPPLHDMERASGAFAAPMIVHFGAVLVLSAVLSAPWQTVAIPATLCGLLGLFGMGYVLVVARRMRVQVAYAPQFEDLLFHIFLPLSAYAALAGSALATRSNIGAALFGIAAAALVLLLAGIHNAWDGVTYQVFQRRKEPQPPKPIPERAIDRRG